MGNSHVATPWIAVLIPARSGDTTYCHRWWCDPGNCHLQHRTGSIGPDKLAYGVLYVLVWDPPGANFVIFQCCYHCFQSTEANIQLRTQLPSRNPPIRADRLIETLFILWCDYCAWPSRTWLVFHVAVFTAETRHPLSHCANIQCLVSVNVQQASMNVNGCNFFCMEEFNYTPLLHMHFHVRLPLCCHLMHGNKT